MATISNRLTNDGILLINGNIDEYTYAGNTSFASKVTANTIHISGEFDELTFNSISPKINNILANVGFNTNTMTTTNGWYIGPNTTYVGSTIAPDNTNTAATYTGNGGGANEYVETRNVNFLANTTYTVSVWARLSSGSVPSGGQILTIVYHNGTGLARSEVNYSGNLTTDWKRFSTTFTNINAGYYSAYFIADQNNTANIDIWGAQIEIGSVATIYQGLSSGVLTNTSVRKITSSGNYYVQKEFDEFTGAPVIDSSLKLWLDAGQSSSYSGSGSTWTDLSPSANNVTLSGSPSFNDKINGGRLTFVPASSQYGATSGNLGNMPKFTVEAWVKVNASLTGVVSSVVTNQYNLASALNYSIGTNNSPTNYNLCVGFFDGSWHNTTGITPTLNTWYQIVGTYDGSSLTQYVNGEISGSAVSYTGTPSSGGVTRIARRWDDVVASGNLFPGDISVVKIYNRALTADEVSQNFNALRNRYGI